MLKLKNDLTAFTDLVQALEHVDVKNKPILIHFTCHGCISDRKIENQIFQDDTISKIICDEYIFVQLFVDDKYSITNLNHTLSNGKKAKSIGSIWSEFEEVLIHSMSQPVFAIVDSDLVLISNKFIDRDWIALEFKKWLKEGIRKFKS